MLVPLVEHGELDHLGADFFVQKYLDELFKIDSKIDTILLGCTHYPHLMPVFQRFVPKAVQVIDQGPLVTDRLLDYLKRHPEMDDCLSRSHQVKFLSTEPTSNFLEKAQRYWAGNIEIEQVVWR
jgi:glutamate racemase